MDERCSVRGMKPNPRKTKRIIVEHSRTVIPCIPVFSFNVILLAEYAQLEILGVTFEAKQTFECHLIIIAKLTSQRTGIMRSAQSWLKLYGTSSTISFKQYAAFAGVLLDNKEFCCRVTSATTWSNCFGAAFMLGGAPPYDFSERRQVSASCILHKQIFTWWNRASASGAICLSS